jgi:hypothetical protein
MDSREYEIDGERACEHDDEVMCHHAFFDDTTLSHLARHKFRRLLEARTHWVIGVTPDCISRALRLEALHQQRCGERMAAMHIQDLDIHPLMCLLPKDQVSLNDIMRIISDVKVSTEVIESKQWILLTSGDVDEYQRTIDRWITTDPVLN